MYMYIHVHVDTRKNVDMENKHIQNIHNTVAALYGKYMYLAAMAFQEI